MIRVGISVVAACAFLATACTAGHPASGPATASAPATGTPGPGTARAPANSPGGTTAPPVRGTAYIRGGCGHTPLRQGAAPGWTASANPPSIPYALAERSLAAGFLFGYPLTAGDPSDKVLWVVATPRNGPLRLTGHPLDAAKPVVSSTWSANSEPGEIYPSIVVAPSPGCWQFTLSWNGHTDTVDLQYAKHR